MCVVLTQHVLDLTPGLSAWMLALAYQHAQATVCDFLWMDWPLFFHTDRVSHHWEKQGRAWWVGEGRVGGGSRGGGCRVIVAPQSPRLKCKKFSKRCFLLLGKGLQCAVWDFKFFSVLLELLNFVWFWYVYVAHRISRFWAPALCQNLLRHAAVFNDGNKRCMY